MDEIGSSNSGQPVEIDYMELAHIIEEQFNHDKENLIMMLQAIQKTYNHLPPSIFRISLREDRCSP